MIVNQLAVVVGWILYIPIVSVWPHSFEIISQRGGQPEGLTDDPRVSKPHVLGQCYRENARSNWTRATGCQCSGATEKPSCQVAEPGLDGVRSSYRESGEPQK